MGGGTQELKQETVYVKPQITSGILQMQQSTASLITKSNESISMINDQNSTLNAALSQ
jgi:hypothetical protein